MSSVSPPCCQQGNVTSWHPERAWKAPRPAGIQLQRWGWNKRDFTSRIISSPFSGLCVCECVQVSAAELQPGSPQERWFFPKRREHCEIPRDTSRNSKARLGLQCLKAISKAGRVPLAAFPCSKCWCTRFHMGASTFALHRTAAQPEKPNPFSLTFQLCQAPGRIKPQLWAGFGRVPWPRLHVAPSGANWAHLWGVF